MRKKINYSQGIFAILFPQKAWVTGAGGPLLERPRKSSSIVAGEPTVVSGGAGVERLLLYYYSNNLSTGAGERAGNSSRDIYLAACSPRWEAEVRLGSEHTRQPCGCGGFCCCVLPTWDKWRNKMSHCLILSRKYTGAFFINRFGRFLHLYFPDKNALLAPFKAKYLNFEPSKLCNYVRRIDILHSFLWTLTFISTSQ